jgi:hypothetical protein
VFQIRDRIQFESTVFIKSLLYGLQFSLKYISRILRRQRAGRLWLEANLGKKLRRPPSQPKSQACGFTSIIPALWEG